MTKPIDIAFTSSPEPRADLAVLFSVKNGGWSDHARTADPKEVLARAAEVTGFSGKAMATMEVVAPEGAPADRLVAIGLGEAGDVTPHDWLRAGGVTCAQIKKAATVTVWLDAPGLTVDSRAAADFASGLLLRAYAFDSYKTKKADDEPDSPPAAAKLSIVVGGPEAATAAFAEARAVVDGVLLARDLVNEPSNVLGPVEFAARAEELKNLGVEVEILTESEMKSLGMGALLGVAQGSVRPPRLGVMQWKGGKAGNPPVAFIGKGVVFDTGGISIKPAGGMEDMKGDMGGAAAVTGLMHALAAREAKVNAVGIIGLVENMPDGNAQRPGDIVTSMSGQTVEVINTDAEGRLVLCDALWYCQDRFKPLFMVNLATLTGAVITALGHHHAGLFSNDDELAARLTEAGLETQEKVWRLPLGPEYDKLLESKFADMRNVGGRPAGSITAAQFLQRFVNDTPWAHLDVAGTAMGSPQNEINHSWASGFGVRLLNELVRAHYEG
ncbi:MAG TPA: leucyl aminopeptidase [Pararhizobium sp.]|nr:leucyl aminopeptidase [Pararhizobium sp.]